MWMFRSHVISKTEFNTVDSCQIKEMEIVVIIGFLSSYKSGPGCSKLTMSLVNKTLKFQMLISQMRQNFLLKKR